MYQSVTVSQVPQWATIMIREYCVCQLPMNHGKLLHYHRCTSLKISLKNDHVSINKVPVGLQMRKPYRNLKLLAKLVK